MDYALIHRSSTAKPPMETKSKPTTSRAYDKMRERLEDKGKMQKSVVSPTRGFAEKPSAEEMVRGRFEVSKSKSVLDKAATKSGQDHLTNPLRNSTTTDEDQSLNGATGGLLDGSKLSSPVGDTGKGDTGKSSSSNKRMEVANDGMMGATRWKNLMASPVKIKPWATTIARHTGDEKSFQAGDRNKDALSNITKQQGETGQKDGFIFYRNIPIKHTS